MLASRAEKITLREVADRCREDQQNIRSLLNGCIDNLTELQMQRRHVERVGGRLIERYSNLLNIYANITKAFSVLHERSRVLEQDILSTDAHGQARGDAVQALLSNEKGLAADVTRFLECSLTVAEVQRNFIYDVNNVFYQQEQI